MSQTIKKLRGTQLYDVEYESLLEAMACERIFTILQRGDSFDVGEACNNYFWVRLTRDQLRQLGEDLIALAATPNQ